MALDAARAPEAPYRAPSHHRYTKPEFQVQAFIADRPLPKYTALPPRYSKFNGFSKSAVVLTFVLESYQPHCAPQADQNALWRSLLH